MQGILREYLRFEAPWHPTRVRRLDVGAGIATVSGRSSRAAWTSGRTPSCDGAFTSTPRAMKDFT